MTILEGDYTVEIWVADDSWGATAMDTTMVDTAVSAFLQSGDDNDIFDWVSAAFGSPWGTHPYTNMIDEDLSTIKILYFDIDGDGLPGPGQSRVVGYFWSKDNFLVNCAPLRGAGRDQMGDKRLLAESVDFDPGPRVSTHDPLLRAEHRKRRE